MPSIVSEQVASKLVTSKALSNIGTTRDAAITLQSKGNTTRIVVNPTNETPASISQEKLDELQAGLNNLPNRKMEGVANLYRSIHGRKSIEKGYKEHIVENSAILDHFYHLKDVKFDLTETQGGGEALRPIVYADAKQLIDRVCEERGITSPNIIVMIDGGGKFFKVCAIVLPQDYCWDSDSTNKRSTYKEGGTMKKGMLSGVKRVMILALVPDIKETHRNIHTLFDIINLNNIEYKIVADFKAMLITLGLQTSTATYPCPFCIVHKDDLAQESDNVPERTFQLL